MSNTWFISDTHFHHKNILKYEPMRMRLLAQYLADKFDMATIPTPEELFNSNSLEQLLTYHDEMLIAAWNSVVQPDDTVWFLGDLGLGNKTYIQSIVARLKGHKRMVRGNHDNWSDNVYREMGFEYVSKYPIILKDWFILSHAPTSYISENTPYFYIYGHVHGSELYQTKTEHSQCVCVERSNLLPVRIPEYDNAN